MAKRIKIGFDIDGCMNNFRSTLSNILERDYGITIPPTEHNWIKYVAQVANVQDFWKKYDVEIEQTLPADEDVKYVMLQIRQRLNCENHIITAREYRSAIFTEKWLKRNGIFYDRIYFQAGNKVDACKWLNIQVMVEDTPENALALANEGIIVLLVEREYNKYLQHKNIIHCQSWLDIYEEISKIIHK